MTYRVRYELNGDLSGMPYVEPGDVLELENGMTARVLWVRVHKGETAINTDSMGIIFSRELERIQEVAG